MAPMFLVSNLAMLKAGIDAGIMGVIPTLNVRKDNELDALLKTMSEYKKDKNGSYGVNIIVQKTNILFEKHLKICVENKVPFYITSLGNPKALDLMSLYSRDNKKSWPFTISSISSVEHLS
jgi:nitronate monooxygenase